MNIDFTAEVFNNLLEFDEKNLPVLRSYLAGSWYRGQNLLPVRTPIDNTVLYNISLVSSKDVFSTIDVLYKYGRWSVRNKPGEERLVILENVANLLKEHMDDIVAALVYDAGKPVAAARGEVQASIDRIKKAALDLKKISGEYIPGDWSSQTLESEGFVRREPYGVVVAITPFNYPLYDSVMKIVASFLPGNAILLKPSNKDALTPLIFTKLLLDAGFPKNSIATVLINAEDFEPVLSDRRIGAVLLTGSSKTGERVLKASGIKSFLMELGGGDPAIVLRDADLSSSAEKVVKGMISYSGQRCDAIKLVLVEEVIYEDFKKLLLQQLDRQVKIGDPRDESTTVGPLIDSFVVEEMLKAIEQAKAEGATVLWGGERLGPTYIKPALIEASKDILTKLYLFNEEVFAPVSLLVKVSSLDEAISIANSRKLGLDAAIFSKNIEWIRKAIRFLEVGAIYVNDYPRHGIGYYPYGGRKDSGIGIEGIGYSIEYVTAYKSIIYNYKGAKIWDYM